MLRKTDYYNGIEISTVYDGNIITSTIYDDFSDVVARGHAKRHPSDPRNDDFGRDLSFYRAMERFAQKNVKRLMKELG